MLVICGKQHLCIVGPTQDVLNGMVKFMTGSDEPFDPVFYERLVTCFNKVEESRLLTAVDAQWQGFLDYASTHGTETDPWPSCGDPSLVTNGNGQIILVIQRGAVKQLLRIFQLIDCSLGQKVVSVGKFN